MTTRSDARTEFLRDIMTTYLEGGVQMTGRLVSARLEGDDALTSYYPEATIRFFDEDEDRAIYVETVAHGLSIIRKGEVEYLSADARRDIIAADRANDAGDIDAVLACAIFEIAIFGKVVYA